MTDEPEQIVWQGRFVVAKTKGKWEYVSRARNIRAAVILAVEDGHVLLVEQFRVALGKPCIELPAGLIGDDAGSEDEGVEAAAGRELEEEAGYRAARIECLDEFWSSPGMLSESFTLVRAHGLTKVGDGGGTESENITVHRVPLAGLEDFLARQRAAGKAIDVRMLMLLGPRILAGADHGGTSRG